jgi:hypothetical protein
VDEEFPRTYPVSEKLGAESVDARNRCSESANGRIIAIAAVEDNLVKLVRSGSRGSDVTLRKLGQKGDVAIFGC